MFCQSEKRIDTIVDHKTEFEEDELNQDHYDLRWQVSRLVLNTGHSLISLSFILREKLLLAYCVLLGVDQIRLRDHNSGLCQMHRKVKI